MAKDDSASDRERSRKSSKSGPSSTTSASSSTSNAQPKKPSSSAAPVSGSGDRLRPPVSTTSSLARKMDEARLEKKKELVAAAKAAVEFEESEANTRSAESDLSAFVQCCDVIRDSLGKMRVETNMDYMTTDKYKHEVVAAFMEMKRLNRYDKIRLKKARDEVNQVKQTVDDFYLQVQNLLSEIMYIKKEITRCLDYKSKAEEIDLVTLQEFYAEAPPEISRPNDTKEDEHQQMLARLEWELELRKKLTANLEEQDLIKQLNSSVIEKSLDTLNQLKPLLSKVVESLQPISVELDIPIDSGKSVTETETAEGPKEPVTAMDTQ